MITAICRTFHLESSKLLFLTKYQLNNFRLRYFKIKCHLTVHICIHHNCEYMFVFQTTSSKLFKFVTLKSRPGHRNIKSVSANNNPLFVVTALISNKNFFFLSQFSMSFVSNIIKTSVLSLIFFHNPFRFVCRNINFTRNITLPELFSSSHYQLSLSL